MEKTNPKVVVFSTLTCPWCVMVKKYLTDKQIEFENRDVSFDYKAAQEMVDRSGQMGVPQLWIGDEVIVGFDREKIDKALDLK